MFNVYSIFAGWMAISFGEGRDYEGMHSRDEQIFYLSYIDSVKEDLDELFNLSYVDDKRTKEKLFDLEGEELLVKTYLYGSQLHIFCSYISRDVPKDYHYMFDYKDFIKDYIEIMSSLKKVYKTNFAYHDEMFEWETKDWEEIKAKLN